MSTYNVFSWKNKKNVNTFVENSHALSRVMLGKNPNVCGSQTS